MRSAFIEELVCLAECYEHIALIVGDLGFSVIEPFVDRFPDRFINAGVAEQNMTGLAAGMASEGYHVFTYSIANFPTFRCAEQIRNDIDYHKLPVTVVAVGGGVAYGSLGYSHHAVQDFSLMRCMPNMLIAAPGDPMEVRSCLRHIIKNPQPSYLRLGKVGEPCFHSSPPILEDGFWLKVLAKEEKLSGNSCFLTTGTTLGLAMQMQATEQYSHYSVYSMPLWSMASKQFQETEVAKWKQIITLEDHLADGGFGSWLMESMPHQIGLRERIVARSLASNIFNAVGSQKFLNQLGGLGS